MARKRIDDKVDYEGSHSIFRFTPADDLSAVLSSVDIQELIAVPVAKLKSSPWLTVHRSALPGIKQVLGPSEYSAFEGVNTGGLNGCYWIRTLRILPDGKLFAENLHLEGKIKLPHFEFVIEDDLVYPLLRGRDVDRWYAEPSAQVILAQDPTAGIGIEESRMRTRFPLTYDYLAKFEGTKEKAKRGTLRGRALYKKYFKPSDPFYSMYNVGEYTLGKWKVLWPEVGHTVHAGVCGPTQLDGKVKPALPDHTVVAVNCESGDEAHFICGMLNSSAAQAAVSGYVALHPSPHVLEYIFIPKFERRNELHIQVAGLSKECHSSRALGKADAIKKAEVILDLTAGNIWGISQRDARAIIESLDRLGLRAS